MNISELSRKLKITTAQLHEVLPQVGIDVGTRAIKIDDVVARKILRNWAQYRHFLDKKPEVETVVENAAPPEKRPVVLPPVITVKDFATELNIPVTKLLMTLMNNGILTAMNEKLDYDTASIIAEDLGFIPEKKDVSGEDTLSLTDPVKEILEAEDQNTLITRPPIVVVLGHVDHGKTTLLDAIRETNVTAQESGGITQHIGAYQVTTKMKKTGEDKVITFLDTPGHEAFTTMRSRGAKIADIAVLVVAADDGVKPQTIEAIKISQAAHLPFVVAINKIDKEGANLDRVKRELSDNGLIPEDWGGSTVCVPLSAKKKTGIDELLEMVLLVAELLKDELRANPKGTPIATVIESHIDKNEGPLATILVHNGTVAVNDFLVIDNTLYGKIRAMKDYRGSPLLSAIPSQPIKIIGFKVAPVVGAIVRAMKTLDKSIERETKHTAAQSMIVTPRINEKDRTPSVHVILKADTLGSLEAIAQALLKIDHPEVKVKIVTRDLGMITTADVLKAEATRASIAGFHVDISPTAQEIAREKGVEIKRYKVIYDLIDDISHRIEGLLAPEVKRTSVATVRVLAVFRSDARTTVVGGRVEDGTIERGLKATVVRQEKEVGQATLTRIQSGKQEIPQGISGQECGIALETHAGIAVGDTIDVYREEEIKRSLE